VIEQWKPIIEYENKYLVSDLGRVKSIHSGKIRIGNIRSNGYISIFLDKKTISNT